MLWGAVVDPASADELVLLERVQLLLVGCHCIVILVYQVPHGFSGVLGSPHDVPRVCDSEVMKEFLPVFRCLLIIFISFLLAPL